MEQTTNALDLIVAFSAFLGLFLSIVLVTHKRGNRRANRLLAMLVFILSLHVMKHVSIHVLSQSINSILYLVAHVLTFLFGPLLLFYTREAIGKKISLRESLPHLIPATISLALMVTFLVVFNLLGPDKMNEHQGILKPIFFAVLLAQVAHMSVYNVNILLLLRGHRKQIRESLSNFEKVSLKWLRHANIGFTAVLAITLFFYIMLITGGYYTFSTETDFAFIFTVSVLINYIGFRSLNQPEIISGEFVSNGPKYQHSPLEPAQAKDYEQKVLQFMTNEKPYLQSDFKLIDLAKTLSLQPYLLSQVLNENLGQNFFEFVNSHRIEAAKQLMAEADWQRQTIMGIAFDVGFNSKSAFNRAFKKSTGTTPSAYLRSIKQQSLSGTTL